MNDLLRSPFPFDPAPYGERVGELAFDGRRPKRCAAEDELLAYVRETLEGVEVRLGGRFPYSALPLEERERFARALLDAAFYGTAHQYRLEYPYGAQNLPDFVLIRKPALPTEEDVAAGVRAAIYAFGEGWLAQRRGLQEDEKLLEDLQHLADDVASNPPIIVGRLPYSWASSTKHAYFGIGDYERTIPLLLDQIETRLRYSPTDYFWEKAEEALRKEATLQGSAPPVGGAKEQVEYERNLLRQELEKIRYWTRALERAYVSFHERQALEGLALLLQDFREAGRILVPQEMPRFFSAPPGSPFNPQGHLLVRYAGRVRVDPKRLPEGAPEILEVWDSAYSLALAFSGPEKRYGEWVGAVTLRGRSGNPRFGDALPFLALRTSGLTAQELRPSSEGPQLFKRPPTDAEVGLHLLRLSLTGNRGALPYNREILYWAPSLSKEETNQAFFGFLLPVAVANESARALNAQGPFLVKNAHVEPYLVPLDISWEEGSPTLRAVATPRPSKAYLSPHGLQPVIAYKSANVSPLGPETFAVEVWGTEAHAKVLEHLRRNWPEMGYGMLVGQTAVSSRTMMEAFLFQVSADEASPNLGKEFPPTLGKRFPHVEAYVERGVRAAHLAAESLPPDKAPYALYYGYWEVLSNLGEYRWFYEKEASEVDSAQHLTYTLAAVEELRKETEDLQKALGIPFRFKPYRSPGDYGFVPSNETRMSQEAENLIMALVQPDKP